MGLADFLNRHAGETAWLFGKGPSFSDFDFKQAGPLRVAINDVAGHVPSLRYAFSNDGVGKWADVYKPGQILFQPRRCLTEYDSTKTGAVACDVVTYDDTPNDIRLGLPRQEIAELPTIRRGTLGSAIQILHIMGVTTIHMVGIDGGGSHAAGFDWRTRLRADHAKDYDAIRSAAIDSAFIMGINLIFPKSTDNTMDMNGKKFVRFLKNALAEGNHYCRGEIASFCPRVAAELVSCHAAEPYSPPEQKPITPAPVESAESRVMKAAENTTIATKKGRGTK